MEHLIGLGSHVQIDKGVDDVKNEGDYGLFFVDDQTLMKVVALFGEDAVKVVQVLRGGDEVTDKDKADAANKTPSEFIAEMLRKKFEA